MTRKSIIRIQQTPSGFWVKAGRTSQLCPTFTDAKTLARDWQEQKGGFAVAVIHDHAGEGTP